MMRRAMPLLVGLIALVLTGAANAQYAIDWYVIGGGGGTSTGGGFELSGTIGQAVTAESTGGNSDLTSGFWVVPPCLPVAPDLNGDCHVDTTDLALLVACVSGADVPLPTGCQAMDLDHDGDVDMDDFSLYQRCYSGVNVPAANCAQ